MRRPIHPLTTAVVCPLALLAAPPAGVAAEPAAPPAQAAPGPSFPHVRQVRAVRMAEFDAPARQVRAVLRWGGLPPGQVRSLVAVLVAGAPDQSVVAFGSHVSCGSPGPTPTLVLWNGTNLVRGRADAVLHLRTLVTVPRSGAIACTMSAYVKSDVGRPGAHASLRSGWLADTGPVGTTATTVQRIPRGRPNPLVPLRGREVVLAGVRGFRPPASAHALLVTGDVFVTECHRSGKSCGDPRRLPPTGTAVAVTWAVATPRGRGACRAHRSRPARTAIDNFLHHKRVEATIRFPVNGSRCSPWDVSVHARSGGGTAPYVLNLDGPYGTVAIQARSR